jgi:hypothetical protein
MQLVLSWSLILKKRRRRREESPRRLLRVLHDRLIGGMAVRSIHPLARWFDVVALRLTRAGKLNNL